MRTHQGDFQTNTHLHPLSIATGCEPRDKHTFHTEPPSDRSTDGVAAGFRTMTLEDELTKAAATGNTTTVEDLLQAGAQVNGVMMMGSSPVAQLLLQYGADPAVRDRSTGSSPLHDAARTGFVDTVRLLVKNQADPQARDNKHNRPVDLARQHGHTEVENYLQSLPDTE
ncbi:hypothetical protein F7725_005921 [Dissostichus mawsoni]|uniref:Uncharacterized protein n=1 Tax=Dissostichus mawsoni TaxID=36200 RepID=A0A7J5YSV8_DISMA|nr:hypothetical protein F7725_005921 [Dissostichus mawsoni]